MLMDIVLYNLLKAKYGRVFWGTMYKSLEELSSDKSVYQVREPWIDDDTGVMLVEIADNNMWNEIAVIQPE